MNTSDINRLLDNSATIETKIDILPRDETESIVTISNNDSVQSWEYSDTRYVPDNGFIGMFVERTLEGTLHNITEDFNIENREIVLHLGIRVYDSESQTYNTNFYSLGNFIVDKPDSDEVKDNTKFTAKDYTIKFNRTFNPDFTDSEYTKSFTTLLLEQGSVTALWLAKYTCKQSGVELGSESFANSTFNITSNQFQNGEQCRDIIKAIAKLACTWARIDWDNKLYLDFDVKFAVEQDYNNITKDDYYSLTIQKDSFGPINKVVFGSSIIDGDYSFVSDENSISQHGENVVTIYDNPILYTEELREEAVKAGARLVGLTYTPVEMETIGHPWLKGNELITVLDSAYNVIYTYPFDRVIKYDGHIKTEIKSYAPTKVQADFTYQGTGTSKNARKQTKIMLDRANQQITSLIEKTDETTSQITTINQNLDKIELDVDTLNTKFESIGVTSKTVEGNPIHITDAGAYDLEKLYLEGNSYQETTSGVNLIDWSKPGSLNGATYTFQDDVLIVSNTEGSYRSVSWDITKLIKNNPNKKLCLYWDSVVQTITGAGTCNLQLINNGTTSYPSLSYSSGGTTYYQIPSDTSGITACRIRVMSNNTSTSQAGSVTITKPMLYFGELNNPPAYEPYTNGASPNPDYPQEVEVIEGSVDVEVVGKNICLTDVSAWEIGHYNTSGQKEQGWGNCRARLIDLIPINPNTKYYVSTNTTPYKFVIRGYDENKNFKLSYGSIENGTSIHTNDIYYWGVTIYNPNNEASTEGQVILDYIENGTIKPFICLESETDKTYEAYKSTTASLDLQDNFLAKIGDVKDELDVVTGKLTKRIGKIVLDGSEEWNIQTAWSEVGNLTNAFYTKNVGIFNIPEGSNKISSHFMFKYNLTTVDEYGFLIMTNIVLRLPKSITSVDVLKTWLASNNVEIYYVLAEPYEVQLDTNSIRLFKGINNISINANLEPSYVSLTYLVDNVFNSQYATKSQLEVTQNNINSVVKDTTTLNANLTDLQALVSVENTNLKNALGDLSNNLEENYATNDAVLTIENSVTNVQTSLNQQIEITKDIQLNGVSKVKTTTGFTFDEDGLTITKTDADTKTNIDEDGMVVYSTTGSEDTEMLVVDSKGVITENVTVRTYLVVGQNSRFQDYETGTGCFYIGE